MDELPPVSSPRIPATGDAGVAGVLASPPPLLGRDCFGTVPRLDLCVEASPDAAAAAAVCRAEELMVPGRRWCPGGIPAWRNGGGCEGVWRRKGGTSCGLRGIRGPPVLEGAGGRRWWGRKGGRGGARGGDIGRRGAAAEARRGGGGAGALVAPDAAAGNAGGSGGGGGGIPGGEVVSLLSSPGTALECTILDRRSTVTWLNEPDLFGSMSGSMSPSVAPTVTGTGLSGRTLKSSPPPAAAGSASASPSSTSALHRHLPSGMLLVAVSTRRTLSWTRWNFEVFQGFSSIAFLRRSKCKTSPSFSSSP